MVSTLRRWRWGEGGAWDWDVSTVSFFGRNKCRVLKAARKRLEAKVDPVVRMTIKRLLASPPTRRRKSPDQQDRRVGLTGMFPLAAGHHPGDEASET